MSYEYNVVRIPDKLPSKSREKINDLLNEAYRLGMEYRSPDTWHEDVGQSNTDWNKTAQPLPPSPRPDKESK